MGKKFELWRLEHRGYTLYNAVLYNRLGGYWEDRVFMGYPKKQVIWKLRNEHSCTVRKEFE